MKTAVGASGQLTAARVAAGIAPKLYFAHSVVKKDASRALERLDAAMKVAQEAPARLVAAATAGILAFSIGFVELVVKLLG